MAKILIVDDSPTVREEISMFFEKHDIATSTAQDGQEGIIKFNADSDIKLVFVDLNMPILDGMSMIEKIRQRPHNERATFLILTTENNAELRERAKNLGVKGWIVKPFNGDNVIAFVRQLVAS